MPETLWGGDPNYASPSREPEKDTHLQDRFAHARKDNTLQQLESQGWQPKTLHYLSKLPDSLVRFAFGIKLPSHLQNLKAFDQWDLQKLQN